MEHPRPQTNETPPSGLRRDSWWQAGTRAAELGAAIALSVAAARWLPKDQVAVLSWTLSMALVLAAIGAVGAVPASIVLLNRPGGDDRAAVVRQLEFVVVAATAATVAIWLLGVGPLAAQASERTLYRGAVLTVAVLVPTAALTQLTEASARGCRQFALAAFAGDYVRRLLVLAVVAAVGLGWSSVELTSALLVVPAVELALLASISTQLRRRQVPRLEPVSCHDVMSTARFSLRFMPTTVLAVCIPQAGVWLGAMVTSPSEVADFAIAMRLSFLVTVPLFIAGRVLAPRIAAAPELSVLEPALRRAARWAGAVAISALVVVAFSGRAILALIVGSAYETAWLPLLLLTVGQAMAAATGLCGACLANRGHERAVSRASIISVGVFIVATLLLAAEFGASGIALAATVSVGGLNIALWAMARSRLGIDTMGVRVVAPPRPAGS
jgi:O-antigen/teichoic acid export membrane protein